MLLHDPSVKDEHIEGMLRRLGSRSPCCVVCGEDHPACLEKHHIAGQAFSDEIVVICCNCHRKVTLNQNQHPVRVPGLTKAQVAKIRWCLGWRDIHQLQAERYEDEARQVLQETTLTKGDRNGS